MLRKWGFVVVILSVCLSITLNTKIPMDYHENESLIYVKGSISDKSLLSEKISTFASKDDFYNWAISAFKNEEIQSISIDSATEVTTYIDYISNQREFEIVLNESQDSEYLVTIVIHENLTYEITEFLLRIA